MKKISLIIIVIGISIFGHSNSFSNPLEGDWKSNKELTLDEWDKDDISFSKRKIAKDLLGQMIFRISEDSWYYNLNGQEGADSYEIIMTSGRCYTVKFFENGGSSMREVCVRGKNMYVQLTQFNSTEVFTRQ